MKSQLQVWWKKIKGHPISSIIISVAIIVVIALIIVIILGYRFDWDWTGLGPYTPPNSNFQRGKTLWDWMQLLIIPAVLAIAGYTFTLTTSQNERRATEQRSKDEQKAAEQRSQTERDIALDNQREAALQDYIDKMSELLLEEKLRESQQGDEVQKIARVRTLTVLTRLDSRRKRSVLQFLYELGLINKEACIVDLRGADLQGANLREVPLNGAFLGETNLHGANLTRALLGESYLNGANLRKANLCGADLRGANLSYANLYGADLTGAYLSGAELTRAYLSCTEVTQEQLKQAKSLKGAIMPDGSKHP